MAGLTTEGFEPKPTEEIQTDLKTRFRAVFGNAITTIAQSVFGQIIGIVSDRLADVWQLGLSLYNASTREGAVGVQLDNIGALTGTPRLQASYSKVTLTLTGTPTTVVPAGSIASIPSTGVQFTNDADATIGGGGTADALFRAVETGPKTAFAGTVTQIDTPVSGWSSVTNSADQSVIGSDVETDAAYRLRQVADLRAQGASTIAAIRAKLAAIDNVIDVFVFENVSDSPDSNGLPPHSFEAVVSGGDEADIAKVIIDNKPVGIATYGTTTESTTDANGFAVDVNFSRPEALEVYITVNILVNTALFPTNGEDLVKQALANYESNYRIGSEVRASALIPSVFAATTGVLECDMPLIGLSPSPGSSTTISANNRQQAELDTTRIVVNITYTIPS